MLLDIARPRLIDGERHRRRHLLYGDLLNLAHTLGYLGGRINGAKDDDGGHGSSAVRVDSATSAVTTVTQDKARTSIY